jgi:phage terminase large subunit GpA-like protein
MEQELRRRPFLGVGFRPLVRLLDWCRASVQTDAGRPYDHAAYPHLGAPGGPMDAYDCPKYLAIWLQWASRLGKSFFGQCATMKTAACDPCPMMFASSDQKLGVEVTARTYRMLEKCPPLRDQLRPASRRKQDLVELGDCRIFVSWARSVSTLADKAVRVGHANEIDKWEHLSTSKEADPLKLFSDRFKEFPSHKKVFESTPAMKHTSRIERGRLASFNAAFWVPCPHCRRYQTLRMDRVTWDKTEAGKSDKDLARRTARYVCAHCDAEIRDEHRGPMMRAGVWIPEGCGCDDEKAREAAEAWKQDGRPAWRGWSDSPWITGTPLRDGRDAGYQLSSLYALSLSWGDIAAEFVDSKKNPQNLRNFVNQWLAETWEIKTHDTTWEKLGERLLRREEPRLVVPPGYSIITAGIDKQEAHYVYCIDAWNADQCSHTLDYGICETEDDLLLVLQRTYRVDDREQSIGLGLLDSGYRPKGVHEFVKRCKQAGIKLMPCRGSSQALGSLYRKSPLGKDSAAPGAILVYVDTITSQDWMERMLHETPPGAPGSMTLFKDALDNHREFLEQLLNEGAIQSEDSTNHTREKWHVIDQSIPNDYRDTKRYSAVAGAMLMQRAPRPRVKLSEMGKGRR